jgi:hypothetical protein
MEVGGVDEAFEPGDAEPLDLHEGGVAVLLCGGKRRGVF